MTYDEIRLSFQGYQERREKIKLLYIELLSNLEQLELMKMTDENIQTKYSLITLDDSTIDRLLIDLYVLISKNPNLVRNLLQIRRQVKIINNAIKIFFSRVGLPMTNIAQIIQEHNIATNEKLETLRPMLVNTMQIISTEFGFQNPFSAE